MWNICLDVLPTINSFFLNVNVGKQKKDPVSYPIKFQNLIIKVFHGRTTKLIGKVKSAKHI